MCRNSLHAYIKQLSCEQVATDFISQHVFEALVCRLMKVGTLREMLSTIQGEEHWADEVGQCVKGLATKPGDPSPISGSTGPKGRTDFCRLSSDLHTCMWYTHNTSNKCVPLIVKKESESRVLYSDLESQL